MYPPNLFFKFLNVLCFAIIQNSNFALHYNKLILFLLRKSYLQQYTIKITFFISLLNNYG